VTVRVPRQGCGRAGAAAGTQALGGVVGAPADGPASGLVGVAVCDAAEVDLAALGVCAGDGCRGATNCLGCHTKRYQTVAAVNKLAIRLTHKTTATASPRVGLALMTASGSGSTR